VFTQFSFTFCGARALADWFACSDMYIQGSFADIQGSFVDIQGSFADVQGSYGLRVVTCTHVALLRIYRLFCGYIGLFWYLRSPLSLWK